MHLLFLNWVQKETMWSLILCVLYMYVVCSRPMTVYMYAGCTPLNTVPIQARSHVKSIDRTIKLESILTSLSGASKASGAYNGVGSRGPLKGPWWGPGEKPRRGPGGRAPGSSTILAIWKALERLSFYNVLVQHNKLWAAIFQARLIFSWFNFVQKSKNPNHQSFQFSLEQFKNLLYIA